MFVEDGELIEFIIKYGKSKRFIKKYGNLYNMDYEEKVKTFFNYMHGEEDEYIDYQSIGK